MTSIDPHPMFIDDNPTGPIPRIPPPAPTHFGQFLRVEIAPLQQMLSAFHVREFATFRQIDGIIPVTTVDGLTLGWIVRLSMWGPRKWAGVVHSDVYPEGSKAQGACDVASSAREAIDKVKVKEALDKITGNFVTDTNALFLVQELVRHAEILTDISDL